MHVHRLVSDAGITEVTISCEGFDRRWLQRQRLINTPVVTYAGYTPVSRATASIEPGGVAYLGYIFEDATGCPICRQDTNDR